MLISGPVSLCQALRHPDGQAIQHAGPPYPDCSPNGIRCTDGSPYSDPHPLPHAGCASQH